MDYSYIDAVETKDGIISWCRDKSGMLFVNEAPLSDYLYAYIRDNTGTATMRDLWGRPMKKVMFHDKWEFRDWCKQRNGLCESDVPPAYKYILDNFANAPTDAPYNILFYDIEVDFDLETGNGYPTPKNPFGEVNSFQAFDAANNKYVMFLPEKMQGIVEIQDSEYPVEMHFTRNERDLLLSVANYIEHVDIMTGWFVDGFDLPYLIERAIIHFGEKEAKKLFCRDGFSARRREFVNEYGEEVWHWILVGRQHLDMRDLYKKFIPGEKTSFSLNAVCEEDLGEMKDEYDGDLGSLYRENPQAFYRYAFQDARLLKLLNDKHQIIMLAVTLARMSCVAFRDVTGSVKPIETGLMKFCHDRGIVLPDKKVVEKEKFPGAIVYDTIEGRHGLIFTIDLGSLYPSCMMMLGLSPETIVMQLVGEYHDYIKVMTKSSEVVEVMIEETGEMMKVVASELEEIIRESGYTISANGTIFSGGMGILSEYTKEGFDLRKTYRKLSEQYFKEGNKYLGELYDLYQKVVKIRNNSIYGCCGEASFRLYDLRLSKSITLTGQVISKWQAYKSNKYVNDLKAA